MSDDPGWRLDVEDDTTISVDETPRRITDIKTGETCDLRTYPSLEVVGATLYVRHWASGTSPTRPSAGVTNHATLDFTGTTVLVTGETSGF